MQALVIPFSELNAVDLPTVGGKGANLGEMTQAGFNVPDGFCVTTAAFTAFMVTAERDIYTDLATIDPEDLQQVRQVGQQVRDYLATLVFTSDLEAAIIKAWQTTGSEYAYAVRSSATAEDLPGASFAGQQDTYLNIRGEAALLAKVKDCFISLFTDRAILYRIQNGFEHRQVALSAVVQRMVQPDVSGILFTADPISGHRQRISIDASFGLGEALVSGLVSADLYQVDKLNWQISARHIARKQLAIRSLPAGGTEQVTLSEHEQQQPALSDTHIIALAQLGQKIENHYGKPQDIEWALVGDELFITQSRPITSLYPVPELPTGDDSLHVYFSLSHLQVMTDAMPPLALALLRIVIPVGHKPPALESQLVLNVGGRLYADLSLWLRHPVLKPILPRLMSNMDQLASGAVTELAARPAFQVRGERLHLSPLLGGGLTVAGRVVANVLWRDTSGATERVNGYINSHVAALRERLQEARDTSDRMRLAIQALQQAFAYLLQWVPDMMAGMVVGGLLTKLMQKLAPAGSLEAIERGLAGNVVTEMNLALGDLADLARATPELSAHLQEVTLDANARLAGLDKVQGGRVFRAAWQGFMQVYGARGPSEIDLSRPRWSEDASSLLQMVVNMMAHTEPGQHRLHYQRLMTEHQQAATALTAAAGEGLWGWLRQPLVRRLLKVKQDLAPLREHHKFFLIQLFGLIKPVVLETGQVWATTGRLKHRDDIWYLQASELWAALDDPAQDLQALVGQRRSDQAHYQRLTPPRLMTSQGEIPLLKLNVTAPEGALVGSPVSAGVVEGIAKVILNPATDTLRPGEILVAPFTDPGWTPLFVNAAGLITEVGGLMTHGSVVAREYGIPAVVGVLDATRLIRTGQRVRVHGDVGYIELLPQESQA